ncbi:hypothetical protein [Agrobacterium sp.]|jgi:hypothetical protein|uniref:hypothetical protein n=1 Tax=Agrobacterium sp. TaxID=361 RepID=UPI0028A59B6B
MTDNKEFSISSNGDRWSLETNDGDIVVLHTANKPSGGQQTRKALSDFLEESVGKPEHTALLQILGQSKNEMNDQLGNEVADPSVFDQRMIGKE